MSFAIALENNAETVANLEAVMDILNLLSKDNYTVDWTEPDMKATIEELSDWFGDIYKILTDYTMFTQEDNNVNS
jgi:DNA-binding transcriptional regulator GbsR (MarR family)